MLLTESAECDFQAIFRLFVRLLIKYIKLKWEETAPNICCFLGLGKLKRGQRLVLWPHLQTPLGLYISGPGSAHTRDRSHRQNLSLLANWQLPTGVAGAHCCLLDVTDQRPGFDQRRTENCLYPLLVREVIHHVKGGACWLHSRAFYKETPQMWVLMKRSMRHSACRVPMLPAFPEELAIAQQTLQASLTYIPGRSGTPTATSPSHFHPVIHSPRPWFWLLCGRGPLAALTPCGTQVAVEPSLLPSWRPVGELAGEAATQIQCAASRGSGSLDENASCQGVHGAKQLCSRGQARGIKPSADSNRCGYDAATPAVSI